MEFLGNCSAIEGKNERLNSDEHAFDSINSQRLVFSM